MIDQEIEIALKKVFYSKAKELNLKIVEVNGMEDHIHILIESNPSISPSDIAKHMKGASSHFVNHEVLKQDNVRSLYWQDGYGVITVSPQAVAAVTKYIQNQKEHHASSDLKMEFERSA